MHDGYVDVVCCLPGVSFGKLFKCVGSFPIFFVAMKDEAERILKKIEN